MANIRQSLSSGLISAVIATIVTYSISLIIESGDLKWALIAVAISSFLSGFISSLRTD